MGFEGKLLISENARCKTHNSIGRKVQNTDSRHLVLMDSRASGNQRTHTLVADMSLRYLMANTRLDFHVAASLMADMERFE